MWKSATTTSQPEEEKRHLRSCIFSTPMVKIWSQ
jgi:hypothetical protein